MMGFFYKVKDNKIVLDEQWERLRTAIIELKKAIKENEPFKSIIKFCYWINKKIYKE
jgi:deoxyribose-phosphate aldolase